MHNLNIDIKKGGKHQYLVCYNFWQRPFPIPFKHNEINRHIIKELAKKAEICTYDEFVKKMH